MNDTYRKHYDPETKVYLGLTMIMDGAWIAEDWMGRAFPCDGHEDGAKRLMARAWFEREVAA